MNGIPIRFEIARGAMQLCASQSFYELWRTMGVSEEEYNICRGEHVWLPEHRTAMRKVLDTFAIGVMDLSQLPRFELPAEYLACVIAVYVHPNNAMQACRVFENVRPAAELAGATVDAQVVDPAQLFALVCAIYDSDAVKTVKASFEKKARFNVRQASEPAKEVSQTK